MHLVQLHTTHRCISTEATPSHKFHHISRCLSDVTKVNLDVVWTEQYMGSSEKSCEGADLSVEVCGVFYLKFYQTPPLSLFPSLWPQPSLRLHFQNTHTKGDKSHCEPGRFPVLMTSCLQTHWNSVAGVMVAHTLTLALSEPYILSRYSNDLWSKWSVQFGWTLKMDVAALGNAALQRLEPGACKTQCREKHLHTHLN